MHLEQEPLAGTYSHGGQELDISEYVKAILINGWGSATSLIPKETRHW
jgi:hypothetical protein